MVGLLGRPFGVPLLDGLVRPVFAGLVLMVFPLLRVFRTMVAGGGGDNHNN